MCMRSEHEPRPASSKGRSPQRSRSRDRCAVRSSAVTSGIRILKEHSKTEVARVIPFEAGSRLEKLLRRRAFLGPDAYVFGEATTGAYVASLKSAWETLLLLANGIKPTRAGSGKRVSNRKALAQIDLHWHDLRHEALSRLADDGVPVHELQLLAGHSSITTTQRYMNARASSLAESMRLERASDGSIVSSRLVKRPLRLGEG